MPYNYMYFKSYNHSDDMLTVIEIVGNMFLPYNVHVHCNDSVRAHT